jgi:WD40 repeat protein
MFRLIASFGLTALVVFPIAQAPGGENNADFQGDPLPAGAVARLGTTRLRTLGPLADVALSPNGKQIASCTGDAGVQLWDPSTGKELKTLHQPNRQERLDRIAFSHDGKTLAAVGAGKKIRFWEVDTGKETSIDAPVADLSDAQAIAYSPDGKYLATAYRSGIVLLWDASERAVLHKLKGDPTIPQALAFSPDSKTLAIAGEADDRSASLVLRRIESPKDVVKLWDPPPAGKNPQKEPGTEYGVKSIAFSPDGKTLVAGGEGSHAIRFWDLEKHTPTRVVQTEGWCDSLAFSRDGCLLACGVGHGVQLRDPNTGDVTWETRQSDSVVSLCFSPDSKALALGCFRQRAVNILRTSDGKPAFDFVGHTFEVDAVHYSPDGKALATGGDGSSQSEGTVLLWDAVSAKLLRSLKTTSKIGGLEQRKFAFAPDGSAMGGIYSEVGAGCSVELFDASTGKSKRHWRADFPTTVGLAYSPDGEVIAVGGASGVCLYSVAEGEEIRWLHRGRSHGVTFAPDGRTLALGHSHSLVEVCDWRGGKVLGGIEKAQVGDVSCIHYSPDGSLLATCGGLGFTGRLQDPVAHLWEAYTGGLVHEFKGDEESVMCVAIAPNGRLFATAGAKDMTVRLWNVFTGKELAKFEGHAGAVLSLDFSPDGKTLASGSADTTVLLWDLSKIKADVPKVDPDEKRIAALWGDLGGKDAGKAYEAIWALAGAPEPATALFKQRLRPVPEPNAQRVEKLIADLNADEFEVREAATDELATFDRSIEETLRKRIDGDIAAEAKQRLGKLLDNFKMGPHGPALLRPRRAVVALELIGSPSAREVLETLAGGAQGADLTRDAKAAFDRLSKHVPGAP